MANIKVHRHGYWVAIRRNNYIYSEWFGNAANGGVRKALRAAKLWRDEVLEMVGPRLHVSRKRHGGRIRLGLDKSGHPTWFGYITDDDGKRYTISRRVAAHGTRKAKKMVEDFIADVRSKRRRSKALRSSYGK